MKKTISFFLSCVMLFTVFTENVFAFSNTSAMEKERQRMYESIEAQLREQLVQRVIPHK